jgi:hypothetical protein
MAQLVERILGKDEVPSSTLGISTSKLKGLPNREGLFALTILMTGPSIQRDRPGIQVAPDLARRCFGDHGSQLVFPPVFPVALYGIEWRLADPQTLQIFVKQANAAYLYHFLFHVVPSGFW